MKKLLLISTLTTIFVANGMDTLAWGGHTEEYKRLEKEEADLEAQLKKIRIIKAAILWQTKPRLVEK
jgi:hypothetical protein